MSEPGKMSKPETASGSFRERLASTKKAWGVLGVCLGVLTLGRDRSSLAARTGLGD
jgi:hypothetical protein